MNENILILRSGVLGDFILSTPAMNIIRERYPDSRIYLLTIPSAHKKDRNVVKVYETKKRSPWLDLLDSKVVDEIIQMEEVGMPYLYRKVRPLIKSLRPVKCYVLTDPLVSPKGNIAKFVMMRMLGVQCKIFGWKDYVLTKKEKSKANELERCVNHTLSCIESVFEDKDFSELIYTVRFPVVIPDVGEKEASSIWEKYNLSDKKVIVIAPGGVKPHKIWPVENYINVIKSIIETEQNVSIILTGTKKDVEIGNIIQTEIESKQIINLIGKTDLPCLAGILKKADLLLGNDGGTMHLGDAVGCTVVAIMPGLELPHTVEPWHNINNAIRIPVECSPCYNFDECPNGSYACMKRITVEEVVEKMRRASKNRKEYNSIKVKVDRSNRVPNILILEA